MSKSLKQNRYYADDDLKFWLNECYFHPSRDKQYQTAAMKLFAQRAMRLLWNAEKINAFGVIYSNQDIRRLMIEEMMPDDLDFAISVFRYCKKSIALLQGLMFYIFFLIINRNEIVDEWFKRTYLLPVEKAG